MPSQNGFIVNRDKQEHSTALMSEKASVRLVKTLSPTTKLGSFYKWELPLHIFWLVGLNTQAHKVHAVMEFGLLYLYSEEGSKR